VPRALAAGDRPDGNDGADHDARHKGTFGATRRTDGKRQLTFDGAPLNTFAQDKKPGDMSGQGLDVSGGY
jgi:predicted lipoprotein with Yx(FWY)xxD motif